MRTRCMAALVLAWGVSAVLAEEQMPWAKDWESAKKAAAEGGKLIMVDFSTVW